MSTRRAKLNEEEKSAKSKYPEESRTRSRMTIVLDFLGVPFQWAWAKITSRHGNFRTPVSLPSPPQRNKKPKHTKPKMPKPLQKSKSIRRSSLAPFPSSRIPQCTFLFVGLDGAGISSIVSNLFKSSQTSTPNGGLSIREISQRLVHPHRMDLKVIDVPGLSKGTSIKEDTEIITALETHLKTSLPNQIPNITFISAPFDPSVFQKDFSNFTRMLLALSHCQELWTDSKSSNIILLLTHSSKVSLESENVLDKISRFQQEFHSVFPSSSISSPLVPYLLLDNFEDLRKGKNSFSSLISKIAISRKDTAISQTFLDCLTGKKERIFQNPTELLIPVDLHLPQNQGRIKEIYDLLLQRLPAQPKGQRNVLNDRTLQFGPYPVGYFPDVPETSAIGTTEHHNSPAGSGPYGYTALPPNSKVTLADGCTELDVQSLNVGDRLLDKNLKTNTITSIQMIEVSENNYKGNWIGKIYLKAICQNGDDPERESGLNPEGHPVLSYNTKEPIPHYRWTLISKTEKFDSTDSHRFFIVELDKPHGAFVADGLVLFDKYLLPLTQNQELK